MSAVYKQVSGWEGVGSVGGHSGSLAVCLVVDRNSHSGART